MLDLWRAYFRLAQIGWDANVVVALRLMRLASGGALAGADYGRSSARAGKVPNLGIVYSLNPYFHAGLTGKMSFDIGATNNCLPRWRAYNDLV